MITSGIETAANNTVTVAKCKLRKSRFFNEEF